MKYAKIATIVLIVVTVSLVVWQLLPNNRFSLFSTDKNTTVKPPLFAIKPTSGSLSNEGVITPQPIITSTHFAFKNLVIYRQDTDDAAGRTILYAVPGGSSPIVGSQTNAQGSVVGIIGVVKSIAKQPDSMVLELFDSLNRRRLGSVQIVGKSMTVNGISLEPTQVYIRKLSEEDAVGETTDPILLQDSQILNIDQIDSLIKTNDVIEAVLVLSNNVPLSSPDGESYYVKNIIIRRI